MSEEQFEALRAWIYEVADDLERDFPVPSDRTVKREARARELLVNPPKGDDHE